MKRSMTKDFSHGVMAVSLSAAMLIPALATPAAEALSSRLAVGVNSKGTLSTRRFQAGDTLVLYVTNPTDKPLQLQLQQAGTSLAADANPIPSRADTTDGVGSGSAQQYVLQPNSQNLIVYKPTPTTHTWATPLPVTYDVVEMATKAEAK